MPYQNIDATLSAADLQAIQQAIDTIQQKLPFLITLSLEERKRLYKMGDKRLAFVKNSLNAAQNNRNILPASFDLDGFANDYQLASSLTDLLMRLNQLTEQVDDTLLAVGSEAMSDGLTVYEYVKTAAKKTPGLKAIAEQLGNLFKAIKTKPASSAPDSVKQTNYTFLVLRFKPDDRFHIAESQSIPLASQTILSVARSFANLASTFSDVC
jgi:hypothetical protein